ncbi:beta-3-deoxy-D-manno-oct-2-ulosonic acid transferase [Novosphingobium aerophilum]|uniref:capsular polysaccharide export protein, LipB/KpsS family n=1 Tax=Novosphingobium aerophilum TaxID=2839843 RepID=UPI003145262E
MPGSAAQARLMQDSVAAAGEADRACLIGPYAGRHGIPAISALCDPWRLADQADRIVAAADHDLAAVGLLLGRPVELVGDGPWAGAASAAEVATRAVAGWDLHDPFTGEPIDPAGAIALLAEWRRLIDANRRIAAVYGVAAWKRVTVDALLWDGRDGPRHARPSDRRTRSLISGSRVIAWKSRTAPDLPAGLAARGIAVGEIEDGFIRSIGLGANCVPPLSIIVDHAGVYFDPAGPSDLEHLLAEADIGADLQRRAAALRQRLVAAGIGKYGRASAPVAIAAPGRRRVLVPGQVADDRSVLSGGAGGGNLELLQRARALEPDAWIIYRPHPDVEAGHRAGHIAEPVIRQWADEIDRDSPIAPLIDSVDALHTLTSLAGFEALMRGKAVTTHGVPFYAGWGLTRDLGAIPDRRGRQRSLDELVAATLILYPRYLDPVTRLPCSPEILVDRLESDRARVGSSLVMLRELQGRATRLWRRFGGQA